MNTAAAFLSPDDVAIRLGLNVRTVRRYIRDGRLKATRIGKQYRIAAGDFQEFVGTAGPTSSLEPTSRTRHVVVTATTDIRAISPQASDRITTTLTAAFGTAGGRSGTHLECIYYEEVAALRVVVTGELEFTSAVLALINSILLDESEVDHGGIQVRGSRLTRA